MIGKGTITRGTQTFNSIKDFKLEKSDTLKTFDNSSIKIKFEDNTLVTLGKNSALNISDYVYDEVNPKNSKSELNFFEGSFKSITGKIGKVSPDRFKLKTKSASIGIRGTIVLGNQSKIMCTQGSIRVSAFGTTVIMPQGTKTVILPGTPPTAPESIQPSDIQEFENQIPGQPEPQGTPNNGQNDDTGEPTGNGDEQNEGTEQTNPDENQGDGTNPDSTEPTNNPDGTNNTIGGDNTSTLTPTGTTGTSTSFTSGTEGLGDTSNLVSNTQSTSNDTTNSDQTSGDSTTSSSSTTSTWSTYLDPITTQLNTTLSDTDDSVNSYIPSSSDVVTYKASMNNAKEGSASTVLSDGSILTIGGYIGGISNISEKYDPYTDTWSTISSVPYNVRLHNALTYNNEVYIIGGQGGPSNTYLDSVYKYDSTTNNGLGSWSSDSTLQGGRYGSGAALFDDTMIVFGGMNGSSLVVTEIYDPNTNTWSQLPSTSNLNTPRHYVEGVTLNDGSVLAIGGTNSATVLSSVEKFDLNSRTWDYVASMNAARRNHTAEVLSDGSVIVFGGWNSVYLSSVEKYDTSADVWQYQVSLPNLLGYQTSALLPNGNVLLMGGNNSSADISTTIEYDVDISSAFASATTQKTSLNSAYDGGDAVAYNDNEILLVKGTTAGIYNPTTGTTTSINNNFGGAVDYQKLLLFNSTAYMIAGRNSTPSNKVWTYDKVANSWTQNSTLNTARIAPGGALYNDSIIVFGGQTIANPLTNSTEIYNSSSKTWTTMSATLNTPRYYLEGVTLNDGSVLAIGGLNSSNVSLASVEKLDVNDQTTWTTVASMNTPRAHFTAETLSDGSVLVFGGYNSGGYSSYVEKYNPNADTWQYQVNLPVTMGYQSSVVLSNDNVLLLGGYQGGNTSSNVYEYNTSLGSQVVSNYTPYYDSDINNGFFVGYENSDKTNKVIGNINSMLFAEENPPVEVINSNSGQLDGNISNSLASDSDITFNDKTTWMKFVQFDGTNQTATYNGEDDKLILGQAQATINNESRIVNIGFQTLHDQVAADNSLSSLDDGSSWGYWQAVQDSGTTLDYYGWWVSGEQTPSSYIANLIAAQTTYSYNGHILGDTFTSSGSLDPITFDSSNSLKMSIDFGAANPITVTEVAFKTQQGWQYTNTTGFTSSSSSITSASAAISATISSASDNLNLDGKVYGSVADSVGGVIAGSITGTDSTTRTIQGVFKADKVVGQ